MPEMVTIVEAAKRTGLAKYFLRRGCLEGKIVHIRAGNKILINLDRLVEYLNTCTGNEPNASGTEKKPIRLIG